MVNSAASHQDDNVCMLGLKNTWGTHSLTVLSSFIITNLCGGKGVRIVYAFWPLVRILIRAEMMTFGNKPAFAFGMDFTSHYILVRNLI